MRSACYGYGTLHRPFPAASLPRPVVVVGVLETQVIQQLSTEPEFEVAPEGMLLPSSVMITHVLSFSLSLSLLPSETIGSTVLLHDSCGGKFVVLRRDEEIHYCRVSLIHETAVKVCVCV